MQFSARMDQVWPGLFQIKSQLSLRFQAQDSIIAKGKEKTRTKKSLLQISLDEGASSLDSTIQSLLGDHMTDLIAVDFKR